MGAIQMLLMMSDKHILIQQITGAMELEIAPIPGEHMSISAIETRLDELDAQFSRLLPLASENGSDEYKALFQEILSEITALKEKRTWLKQQLKDNADASLKIETAQRAMEQVSAHLTEWDESTIRQLVDTVKVLSADEIEVTLKGGTHVREIMK